MTPKEALYWCEQFTDNVIMVDPQREKMVLALQAMRECKKALEKQIPKKVIPFKRTAHDFQSDICKHSGYPCEHIKTFNNEYQYTDYKCPLCHKRVSDGTPKHCDKCGQALDWSDTE